MGIALYTMGVVSITIGCFQFLNTAVKSHTLVCGITIGIVCIVVGIISILDGLAYMKRK